jgi:N-acetylmuramoyl-L-alanine amidase
MYFLTPPLNIQDAPADARHRGGTRLMPPQFIVLHHTGPWPALNWLTINRDSDVSCHRYIEPGKPIYKVVPDTMVANCAGFADVGPWSDVGGANFNLVSLHIEMAYNPLKDRGYAHDIIFMAACQTLEWFGLYGLLPILYHKQVDSRKSDPANFPRQEYDTLLLRGIRLAMSNQLTSWHDISNV